MEEPNSRTIETDIINARECFHTEKYAYLERLNKQTFYNRFQNGDFTPKNEHQALTHFKEQLTEVKKQKRELKEEMRNLSTSCYKLVEENKILVDKLNAAETVLNEKKTSLKLAEVANKESLEMQLIESKWRSTRDELQVNIRRLEDKKNEMKKMDLRLVKDEIMELKKKKAGLLQKVGCNDGDSIIDDLFLWYFNVAALLEKICGFKVFKSELGSDGIELGLVCRETQIELFIKNGRLSGVHISKPCEDFCVIRDNAIKMNDVRYLLMMLMKKIK